LVKATTYQEKNMHRGHSYVHPFQREFWHLAQQVAQQYRGHMKQEDFAVNVSHDAENTYVRAQVPGLKANEIQLTTQGHQLTISGKRMTVENVRRRERFNGEFSRTLHLKIPFVAEKVTAACVDGILTVTLPRTEQAKPRSVPVS
jgi:HSP20 family molecular chaperone IbpA